MYCMLAHCRSHETAHFTSVVGEGLAVDRDHSRSPEITAQNGKRIQRSRAGVSAAPVAYHLGSAQLFLLSLFLKR
jgi:hypothetical protein